MKRRGWPIHAYVGPNGHGKSLAMVYDTIPSLDVGRPVLSTVRLLDFRDERPCAGGDSCDDPGNHVVKRRRVELVTDEVTGGPVLRHWLEETDEVHSAAHPYYVPFRSYEQLLDWRDGDVLMDEVTGVASSRESSSMPVQVANFLVQLRRRNVVLRWTAPNWTRADKIIREVTQAATVCIGFAPRRRPQVEGEPLSLWSDRRLFTLRTYDAALMEEFEAEGAESIKPDVTQRIWRPGGVTERAYDTSDPVHALGWATESGMCASCGGKRSIPRCKCSTHEDRADAA